MFSCFTLLQIQAVLETHHLFAYVSLLFLAGFLPTTMKLREIYLCNAISFTQPPGRITVELSNCPFFCLIFGAFWFSIHHTYKLCCLLFSPVLWPGPISVLSLCPESLNDLRKEIAYDCHLSERGLFSFWNFSLSTSCYFLSFLMS